MRKYNKILSCEKTEFGYWRVIIQTPNDQIHIRQYSGYPKKAVLYRARRTDFDGEAGLFFNQPERRHSKER